MRSRHIERRYLKILEWVAERHILVKFKKTSANRADQFTKAFPPDLFNDYISAPLDDWFTFAKQTNASVRGVLIRRAYKTSCLVKLFYGSLPIVPSLGSEVRYWEQWYS